MVLIKRQRQVKAYLVKDFIAFHSGIICINIAVGKGTTFKFTLPGYLSEA
jgi:signal transduction histidine kinase